VNANAAKTSTTVATDVVAFFMIAP
jgi:hypothetical protein